MPPTTSTYSSLYRILLEVDGRLFDLMYSQFSLCIHSSIPSPFRAIESLTATIDAATHDAFNK